MVEIIVVTGFHAGKNTNDSISNLTDYLKSWCNPNKVKVTEFLYRYNTVSVNHNDLISDARRLKADTDNDLIVLAHSRGALVVYEAARMGEKFSTVILFGAALDNDLVWPQDCASTITNVFNKRDLVLRAGSLLPNPFKHPLGVSKSIIDDYRVQNIDASTRHKTKSWVNTHSDYFLPDNVRVWGKMVLAEANTINKRKLEKIKC